MPYSFSCCCYILLLSILSSFYCMWSPPVVVLAAVVALMSILPSFFYMLFSSRFCYLMFLLWRLLYFNYMWFSSIYWYCCYMLLLLSRNCRFSTVYSSLLGVLTVVAITIVIKITLPFSTVGRSLPVVVVMCSWCHCQYPLLYVYDSLLDFVTAAVLIVTIFRVFREY